MKHAFLAAAVSVATVLACGSSGDGQGGDSPPDLGTQTEPSAQQGPSFPDQLADWSDQLLAPNSPTTSFNDQSPPDNDQQAPLASPAGTPGGAISCQPLCDRVEVQLCREDCMSTCELLAQLGSYCAREVDIALGCLTTRGILECQEDLDFDVEGCDAEGEALGECIQRFVPDNPNDGVQVRPVEPPTSGTAPAPTASAP